jgi:hypothetical protein
VPKSASNVSKGEKGNWTHRANTANAMQLEMARKWERGERTPHEKGGQQASSLEAAKKSDGACSNAPQRYHSKVWNNLYQLRRRAALLNTHHRDGSKMLLIDIDKVR